jgi:multidrug efflux pump
VPVSLVGTFAVMYLCGFSLNNLSLMALILATGLVVDDAIVVLENISRHIENGEPPCGGLQGRQGSRLHLAVDERVAGGGVRLHPVHGRHRAQPVPEFSITLAAAIIVSLVVSLTLTPMLCARWLKPHGPQQQTRLQRWSDRIHQRMVAGYDRSLGWALRHKRLTLLSLLATIGSTSPCTWWCPRR